jgi:RNA polymerase sigma factor (sigma-70 family)
MKMDTMDAIEYIYAKREGKWEITDIIYHYVNGERAKIAITEDIKPMLTELKRLDDNRKKREERHGEELRESYEPLSSLIVTTLSAAEEAERWERNAEFKQAFNRLTPEQQKLLWQIFYLEIPANEIALREGVDKSAISHRLERARAKLKKLLS